MVVDPNSAPDSSTPSHFHPRPVGEVDLAVVVLVAIVVVLAFKVVDVAAFADVVAFVVVAVP
jgi:hypothetical protein